jgi:glutaredoxin
LDGQKCPYCSNKKIKNEDFIKKANEIHENKYDYSFVEYKNAVSKIKIICPSHGEFIQIAKNHIYLNEGCPYCSKNKSNLELFLKNAKIKHNNKYDYSNFTNYTNNKEKIKIICPTHGEFFQIIYNHLSGAGCPKCTETKGESLIRTYLEKNNVKFEQYKRFENCRYKNTLAYDFYLPDHNICIEYDGKQHYEPIDWFGGKKKLKYTIMVDKIKNDYCIKNNIKLFRIKYDENVLDKISSFIIKYL